MRRRTSAAAFALVCVAAFARIVSADAVDALVTCGSALKLKHAATSFALNSQPIAYASGSGQQSVTAIANDGGETDTYWIVHGAHGETCERGTGFAHGAKIRLQHANTRAWLHSHPHRSPLSGNQEVSAYGNDDVSNSGDEWVVELTSGAGANWVRGKKVRFRHVETGAYLVTHGMKFGRPIAGHQEVVGVPTPGGSNSIWMSVEGVYFPSDAENVGKEDL